MTENRYSRQILFSGIGSEGQARLGRSRVLLVGCGALGSVLAEIMVRAGIGSLALADRDYVDESNLQRQSLFTEQDWKAGLPKAVAAARHLRDINSAVELEDHVVDVTPDTIEPLLDKRDLILDGTDNFEARYLINDASLKFRIPWVYGACVGAYGLCYAFVPGRTPCLRCVLEKMPPPGSSPTCDTVGVIGPIVHLVAAFETAEALKILAGRLDRLNPRMITADLWENRVAPFDLSAVRPDPDCPACGRGNYEFIAGAHRARVQTLCGSNAVQFWRADAGEVPLESIARRLHALGPVTENEYLLRAQVDEIEIAMFRDGRTIVRGVRDMEEAKRAYARFIGS